MRSPPARETSFDIACKLCGAISNCQITLNVNLTIMCYVGKVGFEPTHPEGTDLQSAATLQLCRFPT